MPKVDVDNDNISRLDKVLNANKEVARGKGPGRRIRGNRKELLNKILHEALKGDVRDIARRYGDKEGS